MKKYFKTKGFTLIEMLVSIVILVLIILLITSFFSLSQKTLRNTNTKAELIQNSRVALDLISREVRQAKEVVTVLPADNSNAQTIKHELLFQDGHDTSEITYIKFYLSGNQLIREARVFYFESNPAIFVHWNDVNAFGAPTSTILGEPKVIGEYFSGVDFYGQSNINIDLTMQKNGSEIKIKSLINPRNI